ncbi:MAG: methylthioadenosine phosphorylase [Beggiatoa sp. IS2]|nr:MAG: methylthioadenosine phosphorylase [Beggiatoa sp. IS2]
MTRLAIIGGTGLTSLEGLEITQQQKVVTPYGEPSSPLLHGLYQGKPLVFLARHGLKHTIPPHRINYRANVWSLKEIGIEKVIAVAAVGGIHPAMRPGDLVIPHQLIDYTWSRFHTFFEENLEPVTHIDFTHPYCEDLRQQLLTAVPPKNLFKLHPQGIYGATQGPRLETAAEINRMEKDGCDIVGMTGMPEASLAQELGLCYATCAVIANQAAGRGTSQITLAEIEKNLVMSMNHVHQLLITVINSISC